MSSDGWAVDPGLAERFRAAGAQIAWRDAEAAAETPAPRRAAPKGRAKPRVAHRTRIAHLHDEEARVEETVDGGGSRWLVDSGPVGALVLLLEVHRRGPPTTLGTRDAVEGSPFPMGALEATWSGRPGNHAEYSLPPADLIALARYALA